MEQRADKMASKAARSDLESLFSQSKVSKEKQAAIDELKILRGKPEYYKRMTELYEKWGTPLDWEMQLLFLDHRDVKIVCEILGVLKKTAPTMDIKKQDLLAAKLRTMALSTFDSVLLKEIEEIQKALLRK